MASKVLIALMAFLVVAMAFGLEEEEFMKTDPVVQDFTLAEKRGQSMREYKVCDIQFRADQTCWCSRRNGKFLFCTAAAGGEGI